MRSGIQTPKPPLLLPPQPPPPHFQFVIYGY